jgi:SET domain
MSKHELVKQALLEWCIRDHSVITNKIEEADFDGLRGIRATSDIEPDEIVLTVPRSTLFTTELLRHVPNLNANTASQVARTTLLGVLLLHELSKGTASTWWSYLNSMPRTYTTLMYFSPTDIQQLQVSYAVRTAVAAVETANKQWSTEALPLLKQLNHKPKWCSRRAWLWAASTISSRTMYLPWCQAGALTPFGDLHNHCPPPPPYTLKSSSCCTSIDKNCLVDGATNGSEGGAYWGHGRFDEERQEYQIIAKTRCVVVFSPNAS